MIILLVIVGLALLILGHEAGHFFLAKLFKVQVDEFGIGFPPRAFGIKKLKGGKLKFFWRKNKAIEEAEGGTVYSVNYLPFGGFVRIPGENGEVDGNLSEEEQLRRSDGSEVGVPTETSGKKSNLLNFQPVWKRSLIVLAGVIMNFIIGWFLISSILMIGVTPKVVIGGVEPNSPGAAAGFKEGDIVLDYATSQNLINFINANKGKEISINVMRGPNNETVKVTPRSVIKAGEGAVGIYLSDSGIEKQSFFSAIGSGLKEAWSIMKDTAAAFWGVLKSIFVNRTVPQDVMGPVGIVSYAAGAGRLGLVYFLQLLAIISLNLSIINLIPFPALDGGRFLFLLIEKIKGSPMPKTFEAWINGVGFLLMIILMVVVTIRDIGRL